jgi:hypothetical protein
MWTALSSLKTQIQAIYATVPDKTLIMQIAHSCRRNSRSVPGQLSRYSETRNELDGTGIESQSGEGGGRFSTSVQTVPEAQPASFTMSIGGLLPEGKLAGAWR